MKLIIDIPEEYYNCIKEIPIDTLTADMLIIRNGIPMDQCGDCIRRSDVGLTDFEIIMCNGDYREGLKILLEKIAAAPSVTPIQKMGKWEYIKKEDSYRCSLCGYPCHKDNLGAIPTKFCAGCGAVMEV